MNEYNNAVNLQLDSVNSNLTKLEKHSLRIRGNVDFLRWSLRVNAYVFLLTTDEYPPFRLRE